MTRIRVTLDNIVCNVKEDAVGSDEFYIIAAFVKKDDPVAKPKVTPAWDMTDGQKRPFQPGFLLFDENVDADTEYAVVVSCWDRDAAGEISDRDLAKANQLLKGIASEVAEHHALVEKKTSASNWIELAIDGLFYLIRLLVDLDKDDFLGQDETPVKALTWFEDYVDPSNNTRADMRRTFKCDNDGANYDVTYTIQVIDN